MLSSDRGNRPLKEVSTAFETLVNDLKFPATDPRLGALNHIPLAPGTSASVVERQLIISVMNKTAHATIFLVAKWGPHEFGENCANEQ